MKDVQNLNDESARPVVKILLNAGIDLIPYHFKNVIDATGEVRYTLLHSKLYDIISSASKKTIDKEIIKKQQQYKNIKEMLSINLDIYKVIVSDINNYAYIDESANQKMRKMTNEEIREELMKEGRRLYYNSIEKKTQIIVVINSNYSSRIRTIVNKNTSSQTKEQLEEINHHVLELGNVQGSEWRLLKFCYFCHNNFQN